MEDVSTLSFNIYYQYNINTIGQKCIECHENKITDDNHNDNDNINNDINNDNNASASASSLIPRAHHSCVVVVADDGNKNKRGG